MDFLTWRAVFFVVVDLLIFVLVSTVVDGLLRTWLYVCSEPLSLQCQFWEY